MSNPREVVIDYTNHRGERAKRRIIPCNMVFCPQGTEFHSEPGWYLRALDIDKDGLRDFAMADIHSWIMPAPSPVTSTDHCKDSK